MQLLGNLKLDPQTTARPITQQPTRPKPSIPHSHNLQRKPLNTTTRAALLFRSNLQGCTLTHLSSVIWSYFLHLHSPRYLTHTRNPSTYPNLVEKRELTTLSLLDDQESVRFYLLSLLTSMN